jgi:hypothetical protein
VVQTRMVKPFFFAENKRTNKKENKFSKQANKQGAN